jgi:hypothetical protein
VKLTREVNDILKVSKYRLKKYRIDINIVAQKISISSKISFEKRYFSEISFFRKNRKKYLQKARAQLFKFYFFSHKLPNQPSKNLKKIFKVLKLQI